MRVPVVVLFFFVTTLAGCLGGDSDIATDESDENKGPGFDENTGAITGQVLNFDTHGPINNTLITLVNIELGVEVNNTRTNQDGFYFLNYIEPGDYRVHASSPCCEGRVKILFVEANTLNVNGDFFLLPFPDLRNTPYSTQNEFVGFISCQLAFTEDFQQACTHQAISGGDEQQKLREHVSVNPGLETLSLALDWSTPGILGSSEMRLTIEDSSANRIIDSVVGPSPLEWQMHLSDFDDPADGWDELHDGEGWTLSFVVRPAETPSLVFQQRFTVYYDMHYLEPAPDGYTSLPDL